MAKVPAGVEASQGRKRLKLVGVEGGGRGGRSTEGKLREEAAFARAVAEAAQARAEIEAAAVADAAAQRLRTCRVFCEACPEDGMVEFAATRGMSNGGNSWKGLVTAVAAEYVHEVGAGRMVAIEAVVVSDVPGSVGQASDGVAGGPGAEGAAKGGAGRAYGWGRAARCALLMATATFLEEIIGLG
eukprot:jgi/Undpi1/3698/HiC_scaffold_16.g07068.m1